MARLLVALALAAALVGLAPLATASHCVPGAEFTTAQGAGRYVRVGLEPGYNKVFVAGAPAVEERVISWQEGLRTRVWNETNGAPGLQTIVYRCGDGSLHPPDALVEETYTGLRGASIDL